MGCSRLRLSRLSVLTRQLGRRRWLSFHARQRRVDASPARCARRPDRHCGAGTIRIVEGANPNEDQMRSCLGLTEQRGAANRTKATAHPVTAVREAREAARLPDDAEGLGSKARADCSAACAQVLAVAAPAHPRRDRRCRTVPTNSATKAAPCQCHCTSTVQVEKLLAADPTLGRSLDS